MFPSVILISVFMTLAIFIQSGPVSTVSGVPLLRNMPTGCKWLKPAFLTWIATQGQLNPILEPVPA